MEEKCAARCRAYTSHPVGAASRRAYFLGAANCVANGRYVWGVAMLKKPSFEEKTRFQMRVEIRCVWLI